MMLWNSINSTCVLNGSPLNVFVSNSEEEKSSGCGPIWIQRAVATNMEYERNKKIKFDDTEKRLACTDKINKNRRKKLRTWVFEEPGLISRSLFLQKYWHDCIV